MGRRGRVGERATEDSSGTATMQFSLVDRVVAWEAGTSISTIKAITLSEEYLADHFPTFPVFPGVLMLEMLVESAAWLVRATHDFAETLILLREAKNVTYRSFVVPGQALRGEVTCRRLSRSDSEFVASGFRDDAEVVKARFTLSHAILADRHPELATIDEQIRKSARRQWAVIGGFGCGAPEPVEDGSGSSTAASSQAVGRVDG